MKTDPRLSLGQVCQALHVSAVSVRFSVFKKTLLNHIHCFLLKLKKNRTGPTVLYLYCTVQCCCEFLSNPLALCLAQSTVQYKLIGVFLVLDAFHSLRVHYNPAILTRRVQLRCDRGKQASVQYTVHTHDTVLY